MRICLLLLTFLLSVQLSGQRCTNPGQTPFSAFPVCGSMVFKQSTVPICETSRIIVPGCEGGNVNYTDRNPFWYKFTCYVSGTLDFLLTPNNPNDDYDWQLFDVTGKNLNDVYTDRNMVVAGNWAGTLGNTGANVNGVSFMACASDPRDRRNAFTNIPQIFAGRQYLLLISHYTPTQSGYDLEFKGGTAVITDPNLPLPQKAWANCSGTGVTLQLNKKLLCSSLSADGSDFTISPMPPGVGILNAVSSRCNNNFDMDTVNINFSGAIPPGAYKIIFKRGRDNNTLLDECNREVQAGAEIPFNVLAVPFTPMDSIQPSRCAPASLKLEFQKPIWCGSIARDGSDFRVTGPTPVTVTGASGYCVNDHSSSITVNLAGPIQTGGLYTVTLVQGSDGNTLEDECKQQTPAGSLVTFRIKDTVNADFAYNIRWGCKEDTVDFAYAPRNDVNIWRWNFNAIAASDQQSPSYIFKTFGMKKIGLVVSNGFCSASKDTIVNLDNHLEARFDMPDVLCPEDAIDVKDASIGKIRSWEWDFDNGFRTSGPDPLPQRYPKVTIGRARFHTVQLIVKNDLNCLDTLAKKLQVVYTCYIAVPNAFTPNNDSNNDYLYPLNAWKASNLEFRVYNRFGQLIFQTNDWTKKWDGTFRGTPQPAGAYVWSLKYVDKDSGQPVFKKGSTVLIR